MPAYSPTTWVNGTAPGLGASNLNKIENGIAAALPIDGSVALTGQLDVIAGTQTSPAIASATDQNTGIYFAAADKLAISEGVRGLTFDELKMTLSMGAMI
jgi:hypothetical protein